MSYILQHTQGEWAQNRGEIAQQKQKSSWSWGEQEMNPDACSQHESRAFQLCHSGWLSSKREEAEMKPERMRTTFGCSIRVLLGGRIDPPFPHTST